MLPVSNQLTASMGSITFSWDLLILLVCVSAIFSYGLTSGRGRMVSLILSTYFSLVLISFFPWTAASDLLGSKELLSPSFKAFLFLAIAVAISFLMPRSFLGSGLGARRAGRGSWFYLILCSLCEAGLLVAVVLSFLPQKIVSDLNPLIRQFFVGEVSQFFWILLPVLVFVLLKPGRTEL
ncbi:MAG: hypothetical protein HY813_02980 [Candidatus Portnoybacteria bacterium]|nr:hypothetical protein [Candidatus Portnoybacteria bacterium]